MKLNEKTERLLRSGLKGAKGGGVAGAIASVATGAAVVVTAPAWIPVIGGAVAVSTATVATGAAIGAGVGAVVATVKENHKMKKEDERFKKEFGMG